MPSPTPRSRALARIAGAVLLAAGGCGGPGGAGERPDVLLYVVDTLRADGLGCYGNPSAATPNVDRLAREGRLFTRAMAPSSWTRASMGSILSGVYPEVHGAEGRYDVLADGVVLASELFRDAGYRVASITTNPNVGERFGFRQGYAEGDFEELYEESSAEVVRVEELITTCDEVSRAALAWIDRARSPWLLVVHTIDPHSPYTPPAEWDRWGAELPSDADGTSASLARLERSRRPADEARVRGLYLGEIAFNDAALGELLDGLERRGALDRTAVVFTSDHGEEFWELGVRGHGKTVNEKALHVPLVVRLPRVVPAGTTEPRVVSTVDLLPTLCELADVAPPPWIEGRSLLAPADGAAVFSSCQLLQKDLFGVRTERWRLTWDRARGQRALFDLERDPLGERDVAEKHPKVARELSELLERHLAHEAERRVRLMGAGGAPQAEHDPGQDELLEGLGYTGDDEPRPPGGGERERREEPPGEEPR